MASGEKADEHAVHHLLLADDHLADLGADLVQPGDCFRKGGKRWHVFIVGYGPRDPARPRAGAALYALRAAAAGCAPV